jgi:hypothetical protein
LTARGAKNFNYVILRFCTIVIVTTLSVVQQKSMQGIDNKGHNHSTTLQYINMKYILKAKPQRLSL